MKKRPGGHRFLLLLLSPFLFTVPSCSKKEKSKPEKLCSLGVLRYIDGYKFLCNPTAFSPNGDAVNDRFRPITNISPDSFSFRVMRPDGTIVFQSTAENYSWEVTDEKLKAVYEYYVETSIIKSETEVFTACSPLFILKGPQGKCFTNARNEDKPRYRFEDQYHIERNDFVLMTNECFQP